MRRVGNRLVGYMTGIEHDSLQNQLHSIHINKCHYHNIIDAFPEYLMVVPLKGEQKLGEITLITPHYELPKITRIKLENENLKGLT